MQSLAPACGSFSSSGSFSAALSYERRLLGHFRLAIFFALLALCSAASAATVANPTFTPAAGTYTSAQTVAIKSATTGASIRYTTDGSTPSSTGGRLYSSPIVVGSTTTLKAIAYKSGSTNSSIVSGRYTINLPAVANPTLSPAAGSYTSPQSITIVSGTAGATIRYTTDGSTPSSTVGTVYSGTVTIGSTITLKTVAYKAGFTNSGVTTGLYTINIPTVAAPIFSPIAGTYASVQSVTIGTPTSGASIRYTVDGTTPTSTAGTLYSSAVAISANTTLKALAFKIGLANSSVTSGVYTITLPTAATPTFTPAAGVYTAVQNVTIGTSTTGASIRYTMDGTTPSATSGTLYSVPVSIGATKTLKAIAFKEGSNSSAVASGVYTINLPAVAAPTFTPAPGTHSNAQLVKINTATAGASIRYTLDGTMPSATSGTLYASPGVNIGSTNTLKAVAFKSGSNNSAISSGVYTINLPAGTPTFAPGTGFYSTTQIVTISSTSAGASIRYTIDGSTPSSSSGTLYTEPISIAASTTLKAIAYSTGFGDSLVATAVYTFPKPVPYTTDFESEEGYTLGSLNNQNGWTVFSGSARIVSTVAYHGSNSILIDAANPVSELDREFGIGSTSPAIVYTDLWAKPVAGTDASSGTLFEIDAVRISFIKVGGSGKFVVLDGDGVGAGTWRTVSVPVVALDGSNSALSWQRITSRLDYVAKKWDIYVDGILVLPGLHFRSNASSYFSWFSVKGNTVAGTLIDNLLISSANPLFVDVNNNGIDDSWETAHGLSLAQDNRDSDTDGDGLSNIIEYKEGSAPGDYFNGHAVSLSVVAGDQQTGGAGAFNRAPMSVMVKDSVSGVALVNAPVVFTVRSGGGGVSPTLNGPTALSIIVRSDINGVAAAYYKHPASYGISSEIVAAAVAAQVSIASVSNAVSKDGSLDSDGNGLPDQWEMQFFGQLGGRAQDDPDNDGHSNAQELAAGSNPNDFYNGIQPNCTVTAQADGLSVLVTVTDQDGNALSAAPFVAKAQVGAHKLSATPIGIPTRLLLMRTGPNGQAVIHIRN